MAIKHWLFKTEPNTYSIHDLRAEPRRTTCWDGVRNYQARNMLRDEIKKGDRVLIYHSNANPPGVAGTAVVVKEGYPDHTAWEPGNAHFDPKSNPDEPRWFMVDVKLDQVFDREVPLPELREAPTLRNMVLLQKGSRLSVQPVSEREFERIVKMGRK